MNGSRNVGHTYSVVWALAACLLLSSSICQAQAGGGYVDSGPVPLSVRSSFDYILVQFVSSTARDDSHLQALGSWLADIELPRVYEPRRVVQATVYRTTPGPEDSVPGHKRSDYYVVVRFHVAGDYSETRDAIQRQLDRVLNKAPDFLVNEKTLLYQEHNRIRRSEPRDTASSELTLPNGERYKLELNYLGLFDPEHAGAKLLDYGFAQASRDGSSCNSLSPGAVTPDEQWTYVKWYQSVRQHDVVGKYGLYDDARMWLLVPGQDAANYILTMYEYSPAASLSSDDLVRLRNAWTGYYGYIDAKDKQLASPSGAITIPGASGYNYACSGTRGNLSVVAELFKDAE